MKQKHYTKIASLKLDIYHVLKQGIHIGGPIFFEKGLFMDACLKGSTLIGQGPDAHFVLGPQGELETDHLKGVIVLIKGKAKIATLEADRVILTSGASLEGHVIARCMEMAPGSSFQGQLSISGAPEPKPLRFWQKWFSKNIPSPSAMAAKERLQALMTQPEAEHVQ